MYKYNPYLQEFKYNHYIDEFQWHFPTEDDREWLEEALVGQEYYSASDAITFAAESDPTANIVYRSQIVSTQANNERVLWAFHVVNKSAKVMTLEGIATHPSYRGQRITKRVMKESIAWAKIHNPFDINSIMAGIKPEEEYFSSSNILAGEGHTIIKSEGNIDGFIMRDVMIK